MIFVVIFSYYRLRREVAGDDGRVDKSIILF